MPKYKVMINRTRTIVECFEVENVSAKDEESAEEKVAARVRKAQDNLSADQEFGWEEAERDDDYEYEVSEA